MADWELYLWIGACQLVFETLGWRDYRTARWLRRIDPDRARGSACYWIWMTCGAWKAALGASAGMVLMLAVWGTDEGMVQRIPPAVLPVAEGVAISFFLSYFAVAVCTYIALWHALRRGRPLWYSPGIHRMRRAGEWPGRLRTGKGTNRARFFLKASLFVAAVVTCCVLFVLMMEGVIIAKQQFGPNPVVLGSLLIGYLALHWGAKPGVHAGWAAIDGIIAATPEDCWGPGPAAEVEAGPRSEGPHEGLDELPEA